MAALLLVVFQPSPSGLRAYTLTRTAAMGILARSTFQIVWPSVLVKAVPVLSLIRFGVGSGPLRGCLVEGAGPVRGRTPTNDPTRFLVGTVAVDASVERLQRVG
jgi:hypothetical protein